MLNPYNYNANKIKCMKTSCYKGDLRFIVKKAKIF